MKYKVSNKYGTTTLRHVDGAFLFDESAHEILSLVEEREIVKAVTRFTKNGSRSMPRFTFPKISATAELVGGVL